MYTQCSPSYNVNYNNQTNKLSKKTSLFEMLLIPGEYKVKLSVFKADVMLLWCVINIMQSCQLVIGENSILSDKK